MCLVTWSNSTQSLSDLSACARAVWLSGVLQRSARTVLSSCSPPPSSSARGSFGMLVFSRLPPPELFFSPDVSARKPEAMRAAAIQIRRRAMDITIAMNHRRASAISRREEKSHVSELQSKTGELEEMTSSRQPRPLHSSSFTAAKPTKDRGSWIVDESPRRDNLAVPRYRTIYRAEGGRALTSPVVVGHVLIRFG